MYTKCQKVALNLASKMWIERNKWVDINKSIKKLIKLD